MFREFHIHQNFCSSCGESPSIPRNCINGSKSRSVPPFPSSDSLSKLTFLIIAEISTSSAQEIRVLSWVPPKGLNPCVRIYRSTPPTTQPDSVWEARKRIDPAAQNEPIYTTSTSGDLVGRSTLLWRSLVGNTEKERRNCHDRNLRFQRTSCTFRYSWMWRLRPRNPYSLDSSRFWHIEMGKR